MNELNIINDLENEHKVFELSSIENLINALEEKINE